VKKLINEPHAFVDEMLEGLYHAHPRDLSPVTDHRVLVRADAPIAGKVALATGGGSGHLPVFLGYVGRGMLDGCAVGDVFNSPSYQSRCWRLHAASTEARACSTSTGTMGATS
jgi:dihydroxyacetone kinase-like protein